MLTVLIFVRQIVTSILHDRQNGDSNGLTTAAVVTEHSAHSKSEFVNKSWCCQHHVVHYGHCCRCA